ncbi:AMP-binding enzyme [Grosmannia clavigera kw1407]|uniref:AMP-binding enzyme n=1 Tax=Grosmannia clavigera (strain kw1407 / UAMH 11150) TaxID=655863 RepID=F0XJ61_GROCL|nr:AMP-binding enzyme [Grosmannia clavigera kw1407]EFX02325.1 AMP-binding enzyme [Grosmannia clavigera kw1407]
MIRTRRAAVCVCRGRWSSQQQQSSRPRRRLSTAADALMSISHGPTEPPLLRQTIPEHFASIVARYADRPALIARTPPTTTTTTTAAEPPGETVYTYGALDVVSDRLARGLRDECGVRRGDRVAVSLGNGPEFAVLTYAIYKLGAVLVPLNPAFTAQQIAAALSHLDVRLLVVQAVTDRAYKPGRGRSNVGLLADLLTRLDVPAVASTAVPSLEHVVLVDNTADHPAVAAAGDFAQPQTRLAALTPFSRLLGGGSLRRPDLLHDQQRHKHRPGTLAPDLVTGPRLHPDDVINIQFTSGTTAHPKAAMLSHRALLNNGALIGHRMGLRPTDRVVCPPPLFHCFGAVLGYMATATTGAALLLPSPAFDPVAALQMAAEHRATALYGVSTMFVAMLERLDGHEHGPVLTPEAVRQLPLHLHTGIAAGSSVPEALMHRLATKLGLRDLVIGYGMTETAPVSIMTAPEDPLTKRSSTCGRVIPHTAVRIVDPHDHHRVLPRGVAGEIAVSGYLLMDGYYGEPAATADAVVTDTPSGPRWMLSGDEGVMDPDGFVAVTGRIKDLVIRGGENIHPLEIENCLFAHPLIADVAVIGLPDARYGEAVAAVVVPHGGVHVTGGLRLAPLHGSNTRDDLNVPTLSADDVRSWARNHLSDHLVPKHVFWITEYPKTSSGKIQKFKLRAMAREVLGDTV